MLNILPNQFYGMGAAQQAPFYCLQIFVGKMKLVRLVVSFMSLGNTAGG